MAAQDSTNEGPTAKRGPLASRYRSLFVIGRGGMGSVEAALAIEPPGPGPSASPAYERVVALKRLLPDAARDKRRADMFLREARVAAMLDHPNIVRAFDYGEIDGELYLAMEYVEGQPLSRVLRALADAGQRLSPAVVAYVLAEVCRGLHAAHELVDPTTKQPLLLVHRDVSPQNVMVGYDGRVRLLDFGVAKIETENVTKTGEVKGKTAYMSPEQAMGEPLDRRSDLFGVGAVLFECLALRRMWGDGTDMEVIRKLALESPPKLEAAADVPEGMAELHARLVARDAKDRPATAREVAEALDRFAGDSEAAASELRAILEAHFAEQARDQRARLSAALTDVAPSQADELRESLHPSAALTPARTRAAADSAPRPSPDASRRRSGALVLAAAAFIALVAWRMTAATASDSPAAPPSASAVPPAILGATASAAPEATSTPAPEITPPPAISSAPPEPVAAPASFITRPATSITRPATSITRPATSARRPARPTVSPTSPSAPEAPPPPRPATTTSAPRPPDIDDHPF